MLRQHKGEQNRHCPTFREFVRMKIRTKMMSVTIGREQRVLLVPSLSLSLLSICEPV